MIKTVLFDVDGVFLSEERCFDASALSVWELMHSENFVGLSGERFTPTPEESDIRRIRREVFAGDTTLNFVKDRGINSNWDMVFLTFSHQLLLLLKQLNPLGPNLVKRVLMRGVTARDLQEIGRVAREFGVSYTPDYPAFVRDFAHSQAEKQALFLHLNELAAKWFALETDLFSRQSDLWELGKSVYQEWYLGEDYYEKAEGQATRQAGKHGFLQSEIPLAEPARIRQLLKTMRDRGLVLGIGTGRPYLETEVPLKVLGFWPYFHSGHIATASDVVRAEAEFPDRAPLGKPQPFTYLKALLGQSQANETVLEAPVPLANGEEVLIVGDSVADFMAARAMGCQFAATLTGLSGQKARNKFVELGADYICDDILGLAEVF